MLKSASLWAEAGKVTTLMGRNGSGKTTLMRIAAGVLRSDQGVVAFGDEPVQRPSLAALARRGLMFVPQTGLLSAPFRVSDHFRALGAVHAGARADDAIERAAVGPLLDQYAWSLSTGERARVSLALALARRPRVLLADEPLVGIAPADQEKLGMLLRGLATAGAAVVTSGHDTQPLMAISDCVIWSVAGTTHYLGSPARALAHDQFRREYLGPGFDIERP